jgi:hypothetical protein
MTGNRNQDKEQLEGHPAGIGAQTLAIFQAIFRQSRHRPTPGADSNMTVSALRTSCALSTFFLRCNRGASTSPLNFNAHNNRGVLFLVNVPKRSKTFHFVERDSSNFAKIDGPIAIEAENAGHFPTPSHTRAPIRARLKPPGTLEACPSQARTFGFCSPSSAPSDSFGFTQLDIEATAGYKRSF